jgi:fibronectin type 3 domain-containing protein
MKLKRLLIALPVALLLFWPGKAQNAPGGFTLLKSGVTTTTYADTTCPDGVTCIYQVYAVDANGAFSAPAAPNTLPPTFDGTQDYATVTIPISGTHTVTVSWTASATSGVTYSVYRYTGPLAPGGLAAVSN